MTALRRDQEAAGNAVAIDQTGDKSTRLGLLDEVAQEGGACTVGDRGAHRLPDGREATVENPCAAKLSASAIKPGLRPASASSFSFTKSSKAAARPFAPPARRA